MLLNIYVLGTLAKL